MKAYGVRYLGDVGSFFKAYLLSLVSILPLTFLYFGFAAAVAYAFVLLWGVVCIGLCAALTAIFANYGYKFLIYMLAVGANAIMFSGSFVLQPGGAPNGMLLLFAQIVFLFGIFYYLLERQRIRAWADAAFGSDE